MTPPSPPSVARPAAVAVLLLALGGCAMTDAPSLAPRAIERLSTAEPEAPTPPAPAVDPAARGRYAAIVADAHTGDAAFTREFALATAAAAQARDAAPGSESWTGAQQALTRLDAARGPLGTALAALDAERTAGAFDPPALAAAEDAVDAIDARERAAVARLAAGLRAP